MIDVHEDAQGPVAETIELHPGQESLNERLDRYIVGELPEISRSTVRSLIDNGHVLVDGVSRKPSFKVTPGEVIAVDVPPVEPEEIVAENIPLEILFEDGDVIVVNKRAGMVVHPAAGHSSGTLVNALLYHAPEIVQSAVERSGIVHRLDKDTSGVMIVAKHASAQRSMQDQWPRGSVDKRYLALAHQVVREEEAVIDLPLARHGVNRKRMAVDREGRSALTVVNVRERFEDATMLDIDLRTGRTHQIRVHLAYIGHPVLGDAVYGTSASKAMSRRLGIRRQQLHASELQLTLPSGGEPVTFAAPLPDDMQATIATLREER